MNMFILEFGEFDFFTVSKKSSSLVSAFAWFKCYSFCPSHNFLHLLIDCWQSATSDAARVILSVKLGLTTVICAF